MLRFMGIVAPPPSAGIPRRIGGILILVLIVVGLLALGFGIIRLVSLIVPGSIGVAVSFFWGFVLVAVVLGVLALVGRRKQKAARAKAAEQRASAFRG